MKKYPSLSWREALARQPGPGNVKEGLILVMKGMCMGTADLIPGVSGGTIALVTGIYQHLLEAIRMECVRHLLHLNLKQAVAGVHTRFLASLLLGIALALVFLSNAINFLLHTYPVPLWTFFLGLVTASVYTIGKRIKKWRGTGGAAFVTGLFMGYFMVGMMPVTTPDAAWFIFLSGMIAICAMILPGISGAFILLILGKYEFMIDALRNPLHGTNPFIILVFCTGCACGIILFSRVLSYLLRHYDNTTIAVLTGLMGGAMRKIWPWKQSLETTVIHGKTFILRERNILPPRIDDMFWIACGLALIGLLAVLMIEKWDHDNPSYSRQPCSPTSFTKRQPPRLL